MLVVNLFLHTYISVSFNTITIIRRAITFLTQGGQSGQCHYTIIRPLEYIPPVEVEVVTRHKAIPLDANEGIYVRDVKSGKVRAICGSTYMLTQDEELWAKELPSVMEELHTYVLS